MAIKITMDPALEKIMLRKKLTSPVENKTLEIQVESLPAGEVVS